MVMEAPPSPQSVGREFVRQYYTLLNNAPTHLHRFYNHQSSFIHGGLDPNRETVAVIGQKQIHQRIQQLNFRDCHAKITQVDSQSTLGGGVVVQVTGELSNAGQPMRRFTQTFVLASQSPKKYYVHNDIFRYQDEIITDEECDGEIRNEVEEECLDRPTLTEPQQPPLSQPIAPAPGLPFYGGAVPPTATSLPSLAAQPPAANSHVLPPQQPQIVQPPQPAAAATLNGHPDDLSMLQGHLPQTVQQPLGAPLATLPAQGLVGQPPEVIASEEHQLESEDRVEEPAIIEDGYGDIPETELEQEIQHEPASNEPKTYANLLKNSNSANQSQTSIYQTPPPAAAYRPQSPTALGNQRPIHTNGVGGRTNGSRVSGGGPPVRIGGSSHNRGPRTAEDDDRRRSQSSNFGQLDANQLFLGNLPHSATEEELREIFGEYGMVVDLRVHSKMASVGIKPNQGGRAPPNYGFITYENQTAVVACLAARPIYYPKHDKNGTQLNVEEKKNKERDNGRQSYGGRQGFDNNKSGGRGDLPRRGMGPGAPRGGGPGGPQGNGDRNRTGDRENRFSRNGGGGGGGGSGPINRGAPNSYSRR